MCLLRKTIHFTSTLVSLPFHFHSRFASISLPLSFRFHFHFLHSHSTSLPCPSLPTSPRSAYRVGRARPVIQIKPRMRKRSWLSAATEPCCWKQLISGCKSRLLAHIPGYFLVFCKHKSVVVDANPRGFHFASFPYFSTFIRLHF